MPRERRELASYLEKRDVENAKMNMNCMSQELKKSCQETGESLVYSEGRITSTTQKQNSVHRFTPSEPGLKKTTMPRNQQALLRPWLWLLLTNCPLCSPKGGRERLVCVEREGGKVRKRRGGEVVWGGVSVKVAPPTGTVAFDYGKQQRFGKLLVGDGCRTVMPCCSSHLISSHLISQVVVVQANLQSEGRGCCMCVCLHCTKDAPGYYFCVCVYKYT
jgi:hypothetical protein